MTTKTITWEELLVGDMLWYDFKELTGYELILEVKPTQLITLNLMFPHANTYERVMWNGVIDLGAGYAQQAWGSNLRVIRNGEEYKAVASQL